MNPSTSRNPATHADLPRERMLREWLGVEEPEPSFYALLGVPELESDEKAILEAGRRVKRKVRAYQIGRYRKQALALLAEIGQAVSTLTNAEKRRAYDNRLMGRWRREAENLARQHLGQGERTPAALEAWLTACRARGIPVARLMPYLMRRVMARASGWPKVGVHDLRLPVAVWIYRDVAVLGQCLEIGPLEKRIESVKKAQRMLGTPLGIARMVAEEVGRGVHIFGKLRLVRQARDAPKLTLLRLVRRIRRYGGRVGKGKVLAAVARVLGKSKADLDRALARLDESPLAVPRGRKAVRAARETRDGVRSLGDRLGPGPAALLAWAGQRPQVLVVVPVVAVIVSLLVAVLVLFGVLPLYGPEGGAPVGQEQSAPGEEAWPGLRPATAGGTGEAESAAGPPETGPSEAAPEAAAGERPEWLKRFREKYPAERPPAHKEKDEDPPTSEVRFFGVRGEGRKEGSAAPQGSDGSAP